MNNFPSSQLLFPSCIVLEDNKTYGKALCEMMVSHGIVYKADHSHDYHNALERISNTRYALAILDIEIKNDERNGFDVASKIRAKSPETRIIMYTNHIRREYISRFMKLKLDGYVHKNCDEEDLRQILSKVKQGKTYIDDEVAGQWKKIQMEEIFQKSLLDEKKISHREREVILNLCEDISTDEIAKELKMQPNTLRKHITNINKKIKNRTRIGIFKFAMACGLYKG